MPRGRRRRDGCGRRRAAARLLFAKSPLALCGAHTGKLPARVRIEVCRDCDVPACSTRRRCCTARLLAWSQPVGCPLLPSLPPPHSHAPSCAATCGWSPSQTWPALQPGLARPAPSWSCPSPPPASQPGRHGRRRQSWRQQPASCWAAQPSNGAAVTAWPPCSTARWLPQETVRGCCTTSRPCST